MPLWPAALRALRSFVANRGCSFGSEGCLCNILDAMRLLSSAKLYFHRPTALDESTDLYEHEIGLLEGGAWDLRDFRGLPTLFVNTERKCGLTPPFAGFQAV